jgi:hypothetical protein
VCCILPLLLSVVLVVYYVWAVKFEIKSRSRSSESVGNTKSEQISDGDRGADISLVITTSKTCIVMEREKPALASIAAAAPPLLHRDWSLVMIHRTENHSYG